MCKNFGNVAEVLSKYNVDIGWTIAPVKFGGYKDNRPDKFVESAVGKTRTLDKKPHADP